MVKYIIKSSEIYNESTLVCQIEVHARLLILRKIPPCTALFGSARLLILRQNSPLHVYLGHIKIWNKVIQAKFVINDSIEMSK